MDVVLRYASCLLLMLIATAHAAEGNYGPVPIDDDERQLIKSSNDLERYFTNLSLIYEQEAVVSLVREVGHALAPPPTDDYIDYAFFVLRDPSPNAFALPNGHVFVHTGMLARLEDESQLAALLAHEINHVAGHHGILNNRAAVSRSIAGMVLGGLGGWGSVIAVGLQASVYGFSRDLEQEADNRGAALLAQSRFDPHALPEVFDILGRDYEGLYPRTQSIWSTHPEIRARAVTSRRLVRALPSRPRERDRFELAVFPLRALTVRDYIQDDYPHTAVALATTLIERYPDDPSMLALLGDARQALGAQEQFDPEALSNADKRRNQRDRIRRTRAQREAALLETESGRAAFARNLGLAEQHYREALALDAGFAPAQRGLGEVYERLGRDREAAAAYLEYARLAPDAPDRGLIVSRLRALAEKLRKEQG